MLDLKEALESLGYAMVEEGGCNSLASLGLIEDSASNCGLKVDFREPLRARYKGEDFRKFSRSEAEAARRLKKQAVRLVARRICTTRGLVYRADLFFSPKNSVEQQAQRELLVVLYVRRKLGLQTLARAFSATELSIANKLRASGWHVPGHLFYSYSVNGEKPLL